MNKKIKFGLTSLAITAPVATTAIMVISCANTGITPPSHNDYEVLLGKAYLQQPITTAVYNKVNGNSASVTRVTIATMSKIIKDDAEGAKRTVIGTFVFNKTVCHFNINIKYDSLAKSYIIDDSNSTITIPSNEIKIDNSKFLKEAFDDTFTTNDNHRVYNNKDLTRSITDMIHSNVSIANLYDYKIINSVTYNNKDIKSATTESATFIGHAGKLVNDFDLSAAPFALTINYDLSTKKYTTTDFKITGQTYDQVLSLKNIQSAISWSFDKSQQQEILYSNISNGSTIDATNIYAPSIKVNGMANINGTRTLFNEVVTYTYDQNAKLNSGHYSTTSPTSPTLATPFKDVNNSIIGNIINKTTATNIVKVSQLHKLTIASDIDFNNNNNKAQGSATYSGIALFKEDQNTNLEHYFTTTINYDYKTQIYSATNTTKEKPYFASYLTMDKLSEETQINSLNATLASVTPNKDTIKFAIVENSLNINEYTKPTIQIQGHVESTDNKRQTNFLETVTYDAVAKTYSFVNANTSFATTDAFLAASLKSPVVEYLYEAKIANSNPLKVTFPAVVVASIKYDLINNTTSGKLVVTLPITGKSTTTQIINLKITFNYDTQKYNIKILNV